MPKRPVATSKSRDGLGYAACEALRDRDEEARGEGGSGAGSQDRYRLGSPDTFLRASALSDGEGSPDRRIDLEYGRRARRRSRRVYAGSARPEGFRRRAGQG